MTTENRVTLKKVHYAKFASEETNCFSADVYFDGQYAGTARNDGHGGCNMWDYGKKAPGWVPLVEYAASLPAETDPDLPMIDGKPWSMQPDPDYVVDNALEAWLDDRELTRLLSSRVTFIDEDGKLRSSTPKRPAATIAAWLGPQLDKTLASLKTTADKVLNLMPRDAALAAYRRHG